MVSYLHGYLEDQGALGAGPNNGAGDNVMRCLLQRSAEHQYLVGVFAWCNLDGK